MRTEAMAALLRIASDLGKVEESALPCGYFGCHTCDCSQCRVYREYGAHTDCGIVAMWDVLARARGAAEVGA